MTKKIKELAYNELKTTCNPDIFKFKTTKDLEPLRDIIGQGRAQKALEFGLKIDSKGYNLFLSGSTGTGKTSFAHDYIKKLAKKGQVPSDWCYVYNFKNPIQPLALELPAGIGIKFQKDMDEFVKVIQVEIPKAFDNEDYEREKARIEKHFEDKRNNLLEQLEVDAQKQGFTVKSTQNGIYFLPVIDGKTINEEEYNELDETIKNEIIEKSDAIQLETLDIIRKLKNIEKQSEDKVKKWNSKIALYAVGVHITDLKDKYEEYSKITKYLSLIKQDILDNLEDFIEDDETPDQQLLLSPFMMKKDTIHPTLKYKINLLIDNSKTKGAPVVLDFNPTYYNLLGKVEYENEFGTMTTDFSLIKPGLLHTANGGYLILQAKDLLSNPQSWEALKRVLRTKEINIENLKEQLSLVAVSTIKPEPIPIDIKVILVGTADVYQLLYEYDDDFKKLFKIKVDFDEEIPKTDSNIKKLASFIASVCEKDKTIHYSPSGVAKVVEFSSKIVGDQTKLSSRFNDIVEILSESCAWAQIEGSKVVEASHVQKAMNEKKYRSNKYDVDLLELLEDGTILVDTAGSEIGQINGLSVLDMGDYSFGKPSRITANTYVGKHGIINIEREADISGTSHTKGVYILSGYIGQKYAQDFPLALTASVCFEQLYSGVDGDSASSTELYAILSSLAELPINQGLAVTGSVNQKGEIQPIGGVTEKIEGFFGLCKSRKLNGTQGIIIPHQNVKNLHLSDEIIEAVKEDKFHIYPIKTIDEGIEILTGVPAGKLKKDGNYPKDTVNAKVYEKLRKYAIVASNYSTK